MGDQFLKTGSTEELYDRRWHHGRPMGYACIRDDVAFTYGPKGISMVQEEKPKLEGKVLCIRPLKTSPGRASEST